jgi:predicted lipoprotein with Yx(FWY)xxD motif
MKRLLITLAAIAVAASITAGALAANVGSGATVSTGSSSLGRILVDGKGRTLYLFEKDHRDRSSCSGICATYWPPLLTHGKPTAGRGTKSSLLGTIRRAGGTTQVTYAGHPLYRYLPDTKPGQTNGQDSHDFGAGWYVLSSAGKKIEAAEPGNKAQESTKPNPPRYSAR